MAKKTTSKTLRPGLALSGGGFRATLFHLGALWRLNELGKLSQMQRITSVSGGSIISAYLGFCWNKLNFDSNRVAKNFQEVMESPIREITNQHIDIGAALFGKLFLGHPGIFLKACYRKHLFGNATLQSLPTSKKGPEFIIYATNIQSGVSFWFSQKKIGDYRIGYQSKPEISLATAVAASSSFPPFLSPLVIKPGLERWTKPRKTNEAAISESQNAKKSFGDLFDNPKFREKIYLSDGGVYDNMGLEAVWKKYDPIFASAAGAPMATPANPWFEKLSWLLHTSRVWGISVEQNRSLRRRMLMTKYTVENLGGAYWNIASQIKNYKLANAIIEDTKITRSMAHLGTQLRPFKSKEVGHLINWGYALADTAVRKYVTKQPPGNWAWPDPKYPL